MQYTISCLFIFIVLRDLVYRRGMNGLFDLPGEARLPDRSFEDVRVLLGSHLLPLGRVTLTLAIHPHQPYKVPSSKQAVKGRPELASEAVI